MLMCVLIYGIVSGTNANLEKLESGNIIVVKVRTELWMAHI